MIVVRHFLKWVDTARVQERAAAANALARAYVGAGLEFEDRCAAEAALTLLLDDPSAKVRLAMAEALSLSARAPLQIVSALASDQPEIAAMVLARSPLFPDADLIDRVACGDLTVQRTIAGRGRVSMAVAAALAEVGEPEACAALLDNGGAEIAGLSFRRMAERLGHVSSLREAMLSDWRLPSDARHLLLVRLGEALKESPLVVALMGPARAERLTREACVKASVTLIEGTRADEHGALVEHLRLRGDLTASFLVRTVAHGKIDFLGAALAALTGHGEARVRGLLNSGRDVALSAMFREAGLSAVVVPVLLCALKVWREVANGKRVAGAQEVSWLMLRQVEAEAASTVQSELAGLLKKIHLDALRDNARGHALAIAAA